MLASHNRLWISLFFGVERCETVFIIIMKIIMMVIKRKNLTTNVTLLPHTLTLPNSVRPAPGTGWRSAGISCVSWFRVLPPSEWCRDFQCPGTKAPSPARGWCPSPFYLYIFTSVSTSRKTAYFSFLAWSFFTVTLLCCNIGINAKKKIK